MSRASSGAESSGFDLLLEWAMYAVVGGLALLAAVGALLVGPAELGARLEHGRWLPVALEDLVSIAWFWVHHLGDPMGGWPVVVHARLPHMTLYLVLLALEVVLLALVGWTVLALLRSFGQPGKRRQGPARERVAPRSTRI